MPLFEHAKLPSSLKTLYPPIDSYQKGYLQVSDIHEIYYEQSGNPQGQPILFLHGGPGSGTSEKQRCFFDPLHYRIILFDQRGSGQSKPFASLEENTTWDLVADIEKLREHLGITKWIVFGGSWGSTLALSYAVTHPKKVAGLILRGIFTMKPYELDFLYKEGANYIFPDGWEDFIEMIPVEKRGNLMGAYHEILTGSDSQKMQQAAIAWTKWEASTNHLVPDTKDIAAMTEDRFALSFARMEIHYFTNRGFFPEERYLEKRIELIRHIPTVMVHGRYDLVCPVRSAWELHKAFPEAEFHIVADAGHTAMEKGTTHLLVDATDRFRALKY